jgi:hypothetical protein
MIGSATLDLNPVRGLGFRVQRSKCYKSWLRQKSGVALDTTTSKQGSNDLLKSVNGTKLASGTSTFKSELFYRGLCILNNFCDIKAPITRFVAGNKIQFMIDHISERVFLMYKFTSLMGVRQKLEKNSELLRCSTVVISGTQVLFCTNNTRWKDSIVATSNLQSSNISNGLL